MSKKLDTVRVNLVALLTIAFIAFIIIKQDKNALVKPMTLDKNVIWVDFKDTQMDIWMLSDVDVYGFQLEFDGVTLLGSSGGVLEREGFDVSHSEKVILSFDYRGNSIEAGEYLLLTVDVDYIPRKESVKLTNLVLAGQGGKALDFSYYNSIYNTTTFRTN